MNSNLTTNEINIYKTNPKSAERLLKAIESWEVKQYTNKQLEQLQEAVNWVKIKVKHILPCEGLCGWACKEKCLNWLY